MNKKESARLTACRAIIRSAEKAQPTKTNLHGCWHTRDGLTVVSDGYRAVRVTMDSSPLPSAPGMDRVVESIEHCKANATIPVRRVPDATYLADYIKEAKANGRVDCFGNVLYFLDGGEAGEICVNAVYLLDMIKALPVANVRVSKERLSPLYFRSGDSDGVLCPRAYKRKEA